MPFVRRKKGLHEEELYVETKSGWRPLEDVVNEYWPSLATTAWSQYQEYGRGAVIADFVAEELHYAIADAMRGDPELRELLSPCRRYNPKREIVLGTTVVPRHGRESDARLFASVLTPPRGALSPPKAAAYMQRAEEHHQFYLSLRAKMGADDLDAEADDLGAEDEGRRRRRRGWRRS